MPVIWDDEIRDKNIIWDVENPRDSLLPKTARVNIINEKISKRQDLYQQAVDILSKKETVSGVGKRAAVAGYKTIDFLLKSIGGVSQRGVAAMVNPLLETSTPSKDLPLRMVKGVKQGISGEKLGELGDIFRVAGVPEFLSALGGLIGESAVLGKIIPARTKELEKVTTTYGKDIGKNVIRWTTGLPDIAVEHGMKRGWRNVLTKKNIDPTIPTKISARVLDSLDDITQKEYANYGKAIDNINKGFVKGERLQSIIQDELIKKDYLSTMGEDTIKIKTSFINQISGILRRLKKNMQPDDNVPMPFVQSLRAVVRKRIPEQNLIGKKRSLTEEQRFAKDLYNKFNEIIGFSGSTPDNKELALAKKSYTEFKNYEKMILDKFSETVGQETLPTADKIVGLFNQQATKVMEEAGKIRKMDGFLVKKGHSGIENELFDWLTTQAAVVQPQKGGASLYPFRLIAESAKYTTRQTLKTGVPSFIGRQIERAGAGVSATKEITRKANLLPGFGLRAIRRDADVE